MISLGTRRLQPWIYKREGVNAKTGADYDKVLNVYLNYDENKPLSQQTKNPDCILYKLLYVLIWVSVGGAIIDILPWFFYDISETDQKSMIRVIRIRTIVEDRHARLLDDAEYIEGCDALYLAEKYIDETEREVPHKDTVKLARRLPQSTEEEHRIRADAIKKAKADIEEAKKHNEEITIARFVMHEIHRFEDDFGKKQLELARRITQGGPGGFYKDAEECIKLAYELPKTHVKEERQWRTQERRNAKQMRTSARLAERKYPDGVTEYDSSVYDKAYDMPDNTREEAALRRRAMRNAAKQRNTYANYAAPYLYAMRIINLYEGYKDLTSITDDYENVVTERKERLSAEEAENKKLSEIRRVDIERRKAERKSRK